MASLPVLAILFAGLARAAGTPYTASWASLDTHTPAPEWFQDAKFGIYFHYGAFGTAAFGNEWYPRRMYDRASNDACYTHQVATYGDPFTSWPYNDFIDGANDKSGRPVQFAPKLVSAGGALDPDGFAQLFVAAGARFAGPVMEHHDGFSMWDSKVNEWNSVAKGPKLNLAKLWTDAFRGRGLKILAAMHHAYHFTGYYEFAPTPTDPSLQKLFGKMSPAAENQLWYDKLKEVIDEFQPDILWQDFNIRAVDPNQVQSFLSYYYNQAQGWGKEVVATYKDGMDNKGEVYDYERGGPADITVPYWLTDDAISSQSWAYTTGMTYYPTVAILHGFIDRVSKGGNLLLNISPMPDGSLPQAQKDILAAMGDWLHKFGEAIYGTRPYAVYGEGPTKMGAPPGSPFTAPKSGTPQDVRYTKSKDGDAVYAIFLGWPGNGAQVHMASVDSARFGLGPTAKVYLFGATPGMGTSLTFSQSATGLQVTLPSAAPYQALAYALKITKSGVEPGAPPGLADGGTGTVAPPSSGSDSGVIAPPPADDSGTDGPSGSGAGSGALANANANEGGTAAVPPSPFDSGFGWLGLVVRR